MCTTIYYSIFNNRNNETKIENTLENEVFIVASQQNSWYFIKSATVGRRRLRWRRQRGRELDRKNIGEIVIVSGITDDVIYYLSEQ